MSAQLRHCNKRTLCGDKPPKTPAGEDAPSCQRCITAAVNQGYTVEYRPVGIPKPPTDGPPCGEGDACTHRFHMTFQSATVTKLSD
jgi:hypothetical protein